MKTRIIRCTFLLAIWVSISVNVNAQTPNFVRQIGDATTDSANSANLQSSNPYGNLQVAVSSEYVYVLVENTEVFKYNKNGQFVLSWKVSYALAIRSINDTGSEIILITTGFGIEAYDTEGRLIKLLNKSIVGNFALNNNGEIFLAGSSIAKYASDGNSINSSWATTSAGSISDMSFDNNNNLYLLGSNGCQVLSSSGSSIGKPNLGINGKICVSNDGLVHVSRVEWGYYYSEYYQVKVNSYRFSGNSFTKVDSITFPKQTIQNYSNSISCDKNNLYITAFGNVYKLRIGQMASKGILSQWDLNGLGKYIPVQPDFKDSLNNEYRIERDYLFSKTTAKGIKSKWNSSPYKINFIQVDKQGNIYTAGDSNIVKWNSKGALIKNWVVSKHKISGMVIDKFSNVLITSNGSNQVLKFNTSGQLLMYWNLIGNFSGINPVLQLDSLGYNYYFGSTVQKYDQNGKLVSNIQLPQALKIISSTVNAKGEIFSFIDSTNKDLEKEFYLMKTSGGTSSILKSYSSDFFQDANASLGRIIIGKDRNLYIYDAYNLKLQELVLSQSGDFIGSAETYQKQQLSEPKSAAIDINDNVYVLENDSRVKIFNPNGTFKGYFGEDNKLPLFDTIYYRKGSVPKITRISSQGVVLPAKWYDLMYLMNYNSILVLEGYGVNNSSMWSQLILASGSHKLTTVNAPPSVAGLFVFKDLTTNNLTSSYPFPKKLGTMGGGNGRFFWPTSVASSGDFYITDSELHLVQQLDNNGMFIRQWGNGQFAGLPANGDGQFNTPVALSIGYARDEKGYINEWNIFVVDQNNNRIQKFDMNGNFKTKWGYEGNGNGEFKYPSGIATDSLGNVYVVDAGNNRVQVFDHNGTYLAQFGGFGFGHGLFNQPTSITIRNGKIYIVDKGNSLIQIFKVPKYTPTGLEEDEISTDGTVIYPNPATNQLFINSTTPFNDCKILNLAGQIIENPKVDNNKVDISTLQSGVYFIQLKSGDINKTMKFIKE